MFQFTRPHGARHVVRQWLKAVPRFQFTRPHGARRRAKRNRKVGDVSIHAPAWGATAGDYTVAFVQLVSIHAPAWGATSQPGTMRPLALFQFTRPHGARPRAGQRLGNNRVSIHAPAWGATGPP